jgi:hypothetical protein
MITTSLRSIGLALVGLALVSACGRSDAATRTQGVRTLVLGAYTTPREVYGREVLPAFARYWKA